MEIKITKIRLNKMEEFTGMIAEKVIFKSSNAMDMPNINEVILDNISANYLNESNRAGSYGLCYEIADKINMITNTIECYGEERNPIIVKYKGRLYKINGY